MDIFRCCHNCCCDSLLNAAGWKVDNRPSSSECQKKKLQTNPLSIAIHIKRAMTYESDTVMRSAAERPQPDGRRTRAAPTAPRPQLRPNPVTSNLACGPATSDNRQISRDLIGNLCFDDQCPLPPSQFNSVSPAIAAFHGSSVLAPVQLCQKKKKTTFQTLAYYAHSM